MKTEPLENAFQSGTYWKRSFRVYMWTGENGTFRKLWGHTSSSINISSNPLRAILETYSRWRTDASVVFYTWAYFWPNCLFSSKFSFVNSSTWLFQEAVEHYQVTFATGVKRPKVGSPCSLTLFLPGFWHFKLILRLRRGSHQYLKPHQRNSKIASIFYFAGS